MNPAAPERLIDGERADQRGQPRPQARCGRARATVMHDGRDVLEEFIVRGCLDHMNRLGHIDLSHSGAPNTTLCPQALRALPNAMKG
ncbi:MAG: hypothetical protein OEY03_09695 [Rhizobacter sp.]|nr:hypothetical protein [Rhizobacter sp.]